MSIELKKVTYFEKKSALRETNKLPIARIDNIYLGVNIIDIFNGKLNFNKLLIEGVNFRL